MKGKIIDLTHRIEEDMPVFPGTEKPILKEVIIVDKFEFREKKLTMFSHTGTHMDAPYHLLKEGETLDQIPAQRFVGSITLIDLSEHVKDYKNKSSYQVPVELLKTYKESLVQSEFLLLKTDWNEKWGTKDYFESFPAITKEAAQFLVKCGIKGYGVDAISVDLMETNSYEVHNCLLGSGLILIENLTNLDKIKTGDTLIVLPLKIKDSDGSPVRAIIIKE